MNSNGERDTPVRDWVSEDICLLCDRVTLHQFVEFADEPVIESECLTCKELRIYQDSGR